MSQKITPEIIAVFLLRTQVGLDGEPEEQLDVCKDLDITLSAIKNHKYGFTKTWSEGYTKFRGSVEGELMRLAVKRCSNILLDGTDTAAAQLIKSIMFANKKTDVVVSGSIQHDVSAFDHLSNDDVAELIKQSGEDIEETGT